MLVSPDGQPLFSIGGEYKYRPHRETCIVEGIVGSFRLRIASRIIEVTGIWQEGGVVVCSCRACSKTLLAVLIVVVVGEHVRVDGCGGRKVGGLTFPGLSGVGIVEEIDLIYFQQFLWMLEYRHC